MSYCRWSSDSFRCDLYCYEHVDGSWTTHVANNRIPDDAPRELPFPVSNGTPEAMNAWMDSHNALMHYLRENPEKRTRIGGPYDGETFSDPTLEEFRERLLMLRAAGYRFPNQVLEAVEEEMTEEDALNNGNC